MKEEEKKHQWSYKILIIIILILLVAIALLLFRANQVLFEKKPTGNTDIFDIECDCDKEDMPTEETPDQSTESAFESTDSKSTQETESGSSSAPQLGVTDSEQEWSTTNQLKIFKNPVYDMEEVIAPGSSNSYHFVIKNSSNCDMNYQLEFQENNPYQINMQYRLKKNGHYISDWGSYTQVQVESSKLKNKDKDDYILEWKWVESANDTAIGASPSSSYHLSVFIIGSKTN